MAPEGRTGPLPHAAHLTLAGEGVAALGDGEGVPVAEADVGVGEVDEQRRAVVSLGGGGWRSLLDAVVD